MNERPLTFGPLPQPANTRPHKRYDSKHSRAAAQLRARPGEWAPVTVVSSSASAASMARSVRVAYLNAYAPAGEFEAAARTVDGEHRVYARYVGPQQ